MNEFIAMPSQLVQRQGIKALIYGGAGAYKTRSILTTPKPLIVAIENGLLSIQGEQIAIWNCVGNLQGFYKFMEWIKTPEANQFDTFAIDSLSELCSLCLAYHNTKTNDGRRAYGLMADQIIKWVRELINLPNKNVIFICKQELSTNNDTPYHQPALEGKKVYTEITHMLDLILRFHKQKIQENPTKPATEYDVASSINSSTFLARDRSGKLPQYCPPDMGFVINTILSTNK